MKLDWEKIDSIFLDMDGTLLDLHFDNYFWLEHVPVRYAELHNLDLQQAKEVLMSRYKKVEGTMQWYCIDYWSNELELDIAILKQEVDHLIAIHPHVIDFLDQASHSDKRVVLVTNAHGKSLELKMDRTRLGGHFDRLICAHDLGLPKEQPEFWDRLNQQEPFDKQRTLLVDDSLPVLRSADQYGFKHLLAIYKPDSQAPARTIEEFPALHSFKEIMPL